MIRFAYLRDGMVNKTPATIELARRLNMAGHSVTFVGPLSLAEHYEETPFEFRSLFSPTSETGGYKSHSKSRFSSADALISAVKHENPDMILADSECHVGIISALSMAKPLTIVSCWFNLFYAPGTPPLNSTTHPSKAPETGVMIERAWRALRRSARVAQIKSYVGRSAWRSRFRAIPYTSKSRADLRALAKNLGVDLRALANDGHWLQPFVYPSTPYILLNAEELDFGAPAHIPVHYVGPMVGAPDPVHTSKSEISPLIYCTFGSFWRANGDVIRRVISAFRKRPDWRLIVGLGGDGQPEDFPDTPQNVKIQSWAPQREVLQEASVTICHGGVSTINESIATQTPIIVCSTGAVDQPGNGARVAFHGVGRTADAATMSEDHLIEMIDDCLSNDIYTENLAHFRSVFQEYAHSNRAVHVFETIFSNAHSQ
ncbi:MAG: glycosyltransferase [Pseudomonadota bacterium]